MLTAGYGDGIPIQLSNRGRVLLHGKSCPILGRVTMDQTIIDLSEVDEARAGDVVTLIGQCGHDSISVPDFSAAADSISWETLCSITKRVPRIYSGPREL